MAWAGFLLKASGNHASTYIDNPSTVAELAYMAEVEEFNESGGRMDQYTSAIGGIVYLDFYREMSVHPLPMAIKEFVLGESHQPKDTQKTLKRVRTAQEEAFLELSQHMAFKDNFHVTYEMAEPFFINTREKLTKKTNFSAEKQSFLRAALMNHKITDDARDELIKKPPDIRRISHLMNLHHEILRDDLKVSTSKIETMIEKSIEEIGKSNIELTVMTSADYTYWVELIVSEILHVLCVQPVNKDMVVWWMISP